MRLGPHVSVLPMLLLTRCLLPVPALAAAPDEALLLSITVVVLLIAAAAVRETRRRPLWARACWGAGVRQRCGPAAALHWLLCIRCFSTHD